MTDISFWLIIISIFGNMIAASEIVLIIGGGFFLVAIIIGVMYYEGFDFGLGLKKILRPLGILLICATLIKVSIPDKTTMHLVLGIETSNKAIEYIAENPENKMLYNNTLRLLNKKIEDLLVKKEQPK
jgi:hypothetical protein